MKHYNKILNRGDLLQMSRLKFTEDHEWLRLEDDGTVTIGITDYAQDQLGDIVYIELPNKGDILSTGSEAAVIESVKAAGEIKAAIGGEVLAVNAALEDKPEAVNIDPCLLYTSPSPRDRTRSRMPSSA